MARLVNFVVDLWIPGELDRERLLAVCKQTFEPAHRVYQSGTMGGPVVVRRSAWTGVAITLKAKDGQTRLRMNGFAPSPGARVIKISVLYLLYGWRTWRRMTREVHDELAKVLAQPLDSMPLPSPTPPGPPARSPLPRPTPTPMATKQIACPRCKAPNPAPGSRPATLTCPGCGFSGTLN